MVKDKINYRATGKRSALTRQTNQGRANDGGLRIGEMERDGIMGHGLSYFLNESYMVRGDQYYMAVCNKTGTIAIYNPNKNLFLSPMSDGPLKFNRTPEGEPILDVFSRFGRSFSLLRVPYALKLLIQELQVLNIQMRIITEENVDQLLNLSYQSKNISKLLNFDDTEFKDINSLMTQYKTQLAVKVKNANEGNTKRGPRWVLDNFLRDIEPQKFDGINIPKVENMPDITMKQDWSPANNAARNSAWDDDINNPPSWYPAAERNAAPGEWVPQNEWHTSPAAAPGEWAPQNEWHTSSSPTAYNSPGYAPPDFNDRFLRDLWTKLTNEEQNQILALPDEQQEEATKNLIINRPQAPFQIPNYGSDGELNHIFSGLPRLEQIELLKLSYERQIEKLVKLSKNEKSDSNDFSKLRIIIPENKTSSEELYGSPALQMLAPAPANTPVTEEKTPEDKKDISGGSSSSNNIKKIIF